MPELSLQNIDRIARDISREEITFSHLLDELIDHVCCDVENEMQKGCSFQEAYGRVKKKLGSGRIREIQEETLYLVDTKYRNMKKLMKISGVAGTILLGFAALFKIQHWPAAGIMLTLGALLLSTLFLPSALGVIWKESHSRKRIFLYVSAFLTAFFFIIGTLFKIQHWPAAGIVLALSLFSGIFLFFPAMFLRFVRDESLNKQRPLMITALAGILVYNLGMLFKIQHWPGSAVLLISGMVFMFLIALPWYTITTFRNDNSIKGVFMFIIIGSLSIVVPGGLINLNLQNSYDQGYYRNLESQQKIFKAWQEHNSSYIEQYSDSLCHEKMISLKTKTETVIAAITRVEKEMVTATEGKPGMPVADPSAAAESHSPDFYQLRGAFNFIAARNFLAKGTESAGELAKAINDYSEFLNSLNSGKGDISGRLSPEVCIGSAYTPENRVTLLSALYSLELSKNLIMSVEASALKALANN